MIYCQLAGFIFIGGWFYGCKRAYNLGYLHGERDAKFFYKLDKFVTEPLPGEPSNEGRAG